MDLTQLTEEQLKALAFDEIVKRDVAANNLRVILAEVESRQVVTPEED